jgi:TonB family protein
MRRTKAILALLACTTISLAQSGAGVKQGTATPASRPSVQGAVMATMVERRVLPQYPEQAMKKGIQGDVIFKAVVDETGKTTMAVPVEGDPILIAASVDALRDYRFRPYQQNGAPTSVETQLGFHFSLEKTAAGAQGQVECMTSIPFKPEFRTGVAGDKSLLVIAPRRVSGVQPRLPLDLAGKSGTVYLRFKIGIDGKVQDVQSIGGDEPFIGPVIEAVKQDVYEPQMIDGKPSIVTSEAGYHFGPSH